MYAYSYLLKLNSGTAPITNGMATVRVNGLECGVKYNITAGGTRGEQLVGPRSFQQTISAALCDFITLLRESGG